MRASAFAVAVVLLLPAGQAPSETTAINEAVVKAIFNNQIPASYVVYAEYSTMYAPDEFGWKALGAIPADLKQRVTSAASAGAETSPSGRTSDQFPKGAHVVPTEEGLALIRIGPRQMKAVPGGGLRVRTAISNTQTPSRHR